jgi:hypothetical protein
MKTLLFAALLATTASAQTYTAGPLIQVSTTNIMSDCTADNAGSQNGTVVTNSEVEPWIDVNPLNSSNIVCIWQQDRWSDGGSRGDVIGTTFDGGATWQTVQLAGTVLCNGGVYQRSTDPWVSFSPDGTLHAQVLAINEDPIVGGFGRNGVLTLTSTNGGLNWSSPVTLIDTSDPNVLNDKDSLTADSTNPTLVYSVWDRLEPYKGNLSFFTGPTMFARSTDGGTTWEAAREINAPGKNKQTLGNQIVVQPTGNLINLATFVVAGKKGAAANAIGTQRSKDHGVTWDKVKRNLKTQPRGAFAADGNEVFDPESQQALRSEEIIPATAVDPVTGTLYAVWQDSRFSKHAIDEIAFAQSTTAGLKWSKPIKINLTPTGIALNNRQAFTPSIRVATNGTICVTYYDFRNNDAGTPLVTDVWAIFCKPTGGVATNWGNEVRLTDTSFDFLQAPNAEGFFLGDYQGLTAAGNDFLAFWCQSHPGDPASAFLRRLTAAP